MNSFSGAYTTLNALLSLNLQAKSMSLPKASIVSRPQTGLHFSKFKGRGMEFAEVRAYQAGDDIRSIDWKVTARRNAPHTKLFHEERERPVLILCDQSQAMFFGSKSCFKSVKAAQIAALFSWSALKRNDRVGGVVFSNTGHSEVKPARSRKTLMQFLNTINRFNNALSIETEMAGSGECFNDALAELLQTAKPGTLIVLISDFSRLNQHSEQSISKLSQHNEIVCVHVYDKLEESLPDNGLFPVAYGESTLNIDTSNQDDQERLEGYFASKVNLLSDLCTRRRIPVVHVNTEDELPSSLLGILQSYSRK